MKNFEKSIDEVKNLKKFYDAMQAQWRPFSMFGQFSNMRSKICNTDKYGLRLNSFKAKFKKKTISIFDENKKNKNCGVVLGNSTIFGEGSSNDACTIPSILSRNTNLYFYNLCGRGFSGYQEIMNFKLFQHKIKNLKKIVVISGLNDSILPFYIKNYDEYDTPTYGYNIFSKAMEDIVIGWKKKILKTILKPFFSRDINYQAINRIDLFDQIKLNKDINFIKFSKNKKKNIDSYKNLMERNFFQLSNLSQNSNIKVYYFLQPVGTWCKKKKTIEEKTLFNEENKNKKLNNIYKHVDENKYLIVKKIIMKLAKKYKIKFYDLNQLLSEKRYEKEWFFISRFHINDNCNQKISSIIRSKIGQR